MRILEINSVLKGSTGRISIQIAENAKRKGHEVCICVPKGRHNNADECRDAYCFGSRLSEDSHLLLSRITGLNGYFSFFGTMDLLKKINRFKPDIIHLHNLHNSYVNLPMLFSYIKRKHIPVVWTLHDCWAFTGKCPHFTIVNCNKWKTGCFKCERYKQYPKAYFDMTRFLWKDKKKMFSNIARMTIVTPSKWLANLVRQSFLQDYPVKVINNGIDLSVFKPTNSDLKHKLFLDDFRIVLGVASAWGRAKGLDIFYMLAKDLPPYIRIVLVGLDSSKIADFPANVLAIRRTDNQEQLAEFYSMADVFVNPTLEDNFPTVNLEALACGTPVITFCTGGSPEPIDNKTGCVIPYNDYPALMNEVMHVITDSPFSPSDCVEKAGQYDKNRMFEEYIDLYENCACSSKRSIQ